MQWVWRGIGVVAAIVVLLGISVAVAYGPGLPDDTVAAAVPVAATSAGPSPSATASGLAPGAQPSMSINQGPVTSPGPIPVEERPVAVFLGDSITKGMTEPATGEVGEWSWFYGLVDDSNGVLRYGGTVAEIGMTTSWMADQAELAVSSVPDLLVVHGGTNDVSGEITPNEILTNLDKIKAVADAAGVRMAVCTIPPRDEPDVNERVKAYNAALAVWAQSQGVIFLDTAAPLRDSMGDWLPDMSGDGVHPTAEAALLMSAAAAKTLRSIPLGVYIPQ